MIVCLVAAILLGQGTAWLIGLRRLYDLQASARLLVSDISRTRSEAITLNVPFSILVDSPARAYAVSGGGQNPTQWRVLPAGVEFEHWPGTPVTFYSRGNAVPGGTYILRSADRRVRVIVAAGGRIRWENSE